MAANYVLLGSQTVGAAGASSVTFSNIPQTGYTDLKLVCSTRLNQVQGYGLFINPNGLSTNATAKYIQADGATVGSYGATNRIMINNGSAGTDSTASTFGNAEVYIPNYTSANYKSFSSDDVTENNATTTYSHLAASLWSSTAAITSLDVIPQSGASFVQYSSFYLYGIAASGVTPVIAPFATGGNVTNDGTYWIHTFLVSGTFTPLKTLSCDYLVVAGGGGGGYSGGGGAGGYRTSIGGSRLSLETSPVTVTVGAGGSVGNPGASGSNSVFSTITSAGGGGGIYEATTGISGGSGGGGGIGASSGGYGNTPSTSPSQGNNGGIGVDGGSTKGGGGGGGASAVGGAGSGNTGGNGGAGSANSISGSSVTYAGGGGGGAYQFNGTGTKGTGGSGGGGNGGQNGTSAIAGTANTGGGGGGSGLTNSGNLNGSAGAGGSGIVIVRYAMA